MSKYTFCSAIDERLQTFWILEINHSDQGRVNPSSGFDAIKTTDDDLELHVVIFVFVLNLSYIGSDLNSLDSSFYKGSSNLSFGLAYV